MAQQKDAKDGASKNQHLWFVVVAGLPNQHQKFVVNISSSRFRDEIQMGL